MSDTVEVGIYGKLPSHGDFLQRRVPPEFLTPWDDWLQAGIAASRSALADRMVSAEDLALLTLTDEPGMALETVLDAYRAGDGAAAASPHASEKADAQ